MKNQTKTTFLKIRITQVAKDLGIPTKDIIEKCISEGIEGVSSPQASIPLGLAETIKEWFGGSTTRTETPALADITEIRDGVQMAGSKRKQPLNSPEMHAFNFVDGTSTHFVCHEMSKLKGEKVMLDFNALSRCFSELRVEAGWHPRSISMVFLAMDVDNKSQLSYKKALEDAKMNVDITDYRTLLPFLPSGSSAERNQILHPLVRAAAAGGTRGDTPQPSLSARISYAIGLQARHNALELMVLSHDYALCGSLKDLAERNQEEFKVGLVFFRSLLEDPRWKSSGILDSASSPVKWFDLDPHAPDLLGIDLGGAKHETPKRSGLAQL